MQCPLCRHLKAHKHGKTPGGIQRYLCPDRLERTNGVELS